MATLAIPSRRRLTIEEYHRLGEAGVLREDERVELIEGELIRMAPIGSRHAECVSRLNRLFNRQTEAIVRVQDPIQLSEHSEPRARYRHRPQSQLCRGPPRPGRCVFVRGGVGYFSLRRPGHQGPALCSAWDPGGVAGGFGARASGGLSETHRPRLSTGAPTSRWRGHRGVAGSRGDPRHRCVVALVSLGACPRQLIRRSQRR
jgi:putative restriction endonuclease